MPGTWRGEVALLCGRPADGHVAAVHGVGSCFEPGLRLCKQLWSDIFVACLWLPFRVRWLFHGGVACVLSYVWRGAGGLSTPARVLPFSSAPCFAKASLIAMTNVVADAGASKAVWQEQRPSAAAANQLQMGGPRVLLDSCSIQSPTS